MEYLQVKAKNYNPGSIGFMDGLMPQFRSRGVFMAADWEKAKAIIEQLISQERNVEKVEMGLDGDWQYNSMVVWEEGEFTQYDCYEGSDWAEPIILVYYKDAPSEAYSVWKPEAE